MNQILLAHAGHLHTETVTEAGFILSYTVVMWLILLAGSLGIFLVSHLLLKRKESTSLLVMSVFLITYSVLSYQHAGAYSAIALVGGFASAFVLASMKLSSVQQ